MNPYLFYGIRFAVAFEIQNFEPVRNGDWLFGQVTFVEKVTKQGFYIEKVRDATLTGYIDEPLTTASGRL